MTEFAETLQRAQAEGSFAVADSGMGGSLGRLGLDQALLEGGWAAPFFHPDGPNIIQTVHEQDLEAGADIITANTYRANRTPVVDSLLRTGGNPMEAFVLAEVINATAAQAAHQAIATVRPSKPVVVLGSMGTVFDCDKPELVGVTDSDVLAHEHRQHAEQLARNDIDALLVETVGTGKEALIMAEAASKTGLPIIVALYPDPEDGSRLYGGDRMEDVTAQLLELDTPPVVIGANCSTVESVTEALRHIREASPDIPLIGYGQGFDSEAAKLVWKWPEGADRPTYLEAAATWHDLGAVVIGGCCGTTSDYVRDLAQLRDSISRG